MKKYIVAGVPLAGKSTLSNHLHVKYSMSHIPVDGFVTAFEENLPQIGIKHGFGMTMTGYALVCDKVTDFVISFIDEIEDQNIYGDYVIEGCHWNLDKLGQFKNTHEIVVLGYPSSTLKDKFNLVRKVDVNNRTNDLSDQKLKEIINFRIDVSKELEKKSHHYGFEFIDTAIDYDKIYSE